MQTDFLSVPSLDKKLNLSIASPSKNKVQRHRKEFERPIENGHQLFHPHRLIVTYDTRVRNKAHQTVEMLENSGRLHTLFSIGIYSGHLDIKHLYTQICHHALKMEIKIHIKGKY